MCRLNAASRFTFSWKILLIYAHNERSLLSIKNFHSFRRRNPRFSSIFRTCWTVSTGWMLTKTFDAWFPLPAFHFMIYNKGVKSCQFSKEKNVLFNTYRDFKKVSCKFIQNDPKKRIPCVFLLRLVPYPSLHCRK